MDWWEIVLGIVISLAVIYLVLLLAVWIYARRHPETIGFKDALRLLPDLLRAIRRITADKTVNTAVRVKLTLLLIYLISPIDLVPDFLPVIGHADDIIIVAITLRSVIRSAGPELLRRHWPGTQPGLTVIERLAGIH
ncbi:YkvA family protein [Psychromicrobium lacuslunae]|uniref:DUF1232 domain-containing protein n=1 Tax=Psychromicrobium lacuslunae TaxID=1618207 RepID=A0A0D4BWE8_9MICC|nr:DUF1232 domain-containing protein [Psychromicrobium lacuslunae]AJT40782.1 hypothetical protein UM93_03260 [Psychromicrobium lacuslunae]